MTPAKRPSTRARQTPIQSLDDLKPDPLNANRGTDRGREALRRSLHTYGAGRSIVIDKRGRILGGAQDRGTGQAPGGSRSRWCPPPAKNSLWCSVWIWMRGPTPAPRNWR